MSSDGEHHSSEAAVSAESGDENSEDDLQDQIAEIPFEERQRLLSDGCSAFTSALQEKVIPKRANKNRPVEMSSKKSVPRYREVIQAPKLVFRDPRFERLCGSFEESKFKKSYSFLYDEDLPAEKKRRQKLLEKEKFSGAVKEIQKHITWIDSQLKEEELRRKRAQNAMEQRHKEKEAVRKGKKPFFVKKSELRKQELLEKYKGLKASGKLEAFLAKRRRRNAAKDHRYIPYRRPQQDSIVHSGGGAA